MSIDRTNYNALIDDDGSNTVGTLWNKNIVKTVLLDPIDAALVSLTGNPTAPTPPPGDNDTSIATTAFVQAAITGQARFYASVFNSVAQSMPASAFTNLTFNSETMDVGNLHDPAVNPSRITVPAGGAGLYLIVGVLTWAGSGSGGVRQGLINKNGSGTNLITSVTPPSAAMEPQNIGVVVAQLAVGDYIELMGYQDGTVALNTSAAKTFLTAVRLF